MQLKYDVRLRVTISATRVEVVRVVCVLCAFEFRVFDGASVAVVRVGVNLIRND